MLKHGLALLLAAGLAGSAACANDDPPNPSETALFARVDQALASNPPSTADIVKAFGLPADCERKSCFFEASQIAGARSERGNLRSNADGLIFVLEKLSGECIRASAVTRRFRTGPAEQSCFDAQCWYLRSQHDWGIVSFEVVTPEAQCVSSVVINTLPEMRARN